MMMMTVMRRRMKLITKTLTTMMVMMMMMTMMEVMTVMIITKNIAMEMLKVKMLMMEVKINNQQSRC